MNFGEYSGTELFEVFLYSQKCDAIAGLQPRSVHTTLNFSISVTVLPVDSNEEDKGEADFYFA